MQAVNFPRVGVGVIIVRNGSILLGLRKGEHGKGQWAPPGGHLEFGENFEACAKRELAEEVGGMKVQNIRVGIVTNDIFHESQKHYVTIHMLADYVSGTPASLEPEKCEEWKWFSLDKLPIPLMLPLHNALKQGLDTYFD